jgi:hypothetical protein
MFARTKATALLARADGKEQVAQGFKQLAADPSFKKQSPVIKEKTFALIAIGKTGEMPELTDLSRRALQMTPARTGPATRFWQALAVQGQKAGAKGLDPKEALRAAKSSPLAPPKFIRVADDASPEEASKARRQNLANLNQWVLRMTRHMGQADKQLKLVKYAEDLRRIDIPSVTDDVLVLLQDDPELQQAARKQIEEKLRPQQKRLQETFKRLTREKQHIRRRGGRIGRAAHTRTAGVKPRYFKPNVRGGKASESFLQATGTEGALPKGTPMRPNMKLGGGDVSQQVAKALAGMGQGPITPQHLGRIAQVVAKQVAEQAAKEVVQQLLAGAEAPTSGASEPQKRTHKGKVDGWGVPRSFERDLGGAAREPVRPRESAVAVDGDAPTLEEVLSEKEVGRPIIKDKSTVRDLAALFQSGWKDLSAGEKAALKNLGWNQQTWDAKDSEGAQWAQAHSQPFVLLTRTQRRSLRDLGFTPHDWDKRVQAFTSGKNA